MSTVQNLRRLSAGVVEARRNWLIDEVNESCLRMAVMTGEFPWHSHPGSAEQFIVLEGKLFIDFENGSTVALEPMDVYTVPAGVVHRTRAPTRTVNLSIEHTKAETRFTV